MSTTLPKSRRPQKSRVFSTPSLSRSDFSHTTHSNTVDIVDTTTATSTSFEQSLLNPQSIIQKIFYNFFLFLFSCLFLISSLYAHQSIQNIELSGYLKSNSFTSHHLLVNLDFITRCKNKTNSAYLIKFHFFR